MRRPTFSLWALFTGALSLFSSLLFHAFSSRNLPATVWSVSWATRSQNAPLPGSHAARGAADRILLPQCWIYCFHFLLPALLCVLWFGGRLVAKAGANWPGLRFLDRHRAIFQERDDLCAVYLQAPVVADQALLPELVHEFTYPRARSTNHLCQG